jgi:hypothetical protein
VEFLAVRRFVDLPPTIRTPSFRGLASEWHHEILVPTASVERPLKVMTRHALTVVD